MRLILTGLQVNNAQCRHMLCSVAKKTAFIMLWWYFFCEKHTCRSRWRRCSCFLPLSGFYRHAPDKGVINAHQDVLWLNVCVNDLALCVKVIQTLQHLPVKYTTFRSLRCRIRNELIFMLLYIHEII